MPELVVLNCGADGGEYCMTARGRNESEFVGGGIRFAAGGGGVPEGAELAGSLGL